MAVIVAHPRRSRYADRPGVLQTFPNWSFNRTANGMSPWPRGSVVDHLPRGQGATPSAAG
jgi:hypothetical protein